MATIRETYALREPGQIAGLPGVWPAGATVTVERDTASGLATVVQVLPGPGGETAPAEDPGTVATAPDAGEITPAPGDGPASGEFVVAAPAAPMRFSDEEGGD